MARYHVSETISGTVHYTVEADSPQEAVNKSRAGELEPDELDWDGVGDAEAEEVK